ncbi:MAG: hypothetical protein ABIF92_00395 [archaeon]
MLVSKKKFLALPLAHQERIVEALFLAEHKNFSKSKAGIEINVPAGYSIRAAAILECELPKEIVKKIIVLEQDANEFISKLDVDEFSEYAAQLEKTGIFLPARDDLIVITPENVPPEAYRNKKGKLIFISIDTVLAGIDEQYDKDKKLRKVLQHYGFVKDKDTNSY